MNFWEAFDRVVLQKIFGLAPSGGVRTFAELWAIHCYMNNKSVFDRMAEM